MYKLIGAEDIINRGVTSLAQLRPVLTQDTDPLAANATLRKDEWEQIDGRVNDVMRERLTIADDLRARGLVTNVSLGTILRVTERLSDFDPAELSFDGDTAPQKDRADFKRDVIPVPVISKDFAVNWRQLEASRRRGDPLDVTNAALAARKVRDKLQDLIVNGYTGGPGANPANGTDGQSIPGLLSHANRMTSAIGDWTLDPATNPCIANVKTALGVAYGQNFFGPFIMYVPKNFWAALQQDYNNAKGEKTFIERIKAFEDIEDVRPLDTLPASNVVLVQMTEDVIELTEAQIVTTVQWEKNPFVMNFRVLTVAGPHIKNVETSAGASGGASTKVGIVHMS
jgi:uncharacterized linocin/CFP29 family protein